MSGPVTEWFVEIAWRDPKAAGAKEPTTKLGPFDSEQGRDAFMETYRRDRAVGQLRVLVRQATYTELAYVGEPEPLDEETHRLANERLFEQMKT